MQNGRFNGQVTQESHSKRKEFIKFYSESERSLSLYEGNLQDEDIKTIIETGICIDIFWLSINNITEIGAEYLSKAKLQLKELYLSWNKLGIEGTRHISMAKWPKLKKIWLVNNNIGSKGVRYISKANWKCLEELNIGMNNVNNQGCSHLAKADWKALRKLWIAENNIGEEGVRHLIKANWKKLTHFSLWCNLVTIEGSKILLQVDWPRLVSLNLLRNPIDTFEVETIREMLLFKTQAELDI